MWDYRVIKTTHGEEDFYQIHDTYYNKAGDIYAISTEPTNPCGVSLDGLKKDLRLMLNDCDKPVLVKDEIVFAKPDWENEG